MTDGISKIGRSAVEMNTPADKLKNNKTANEASVEKTETANPVPVNDEVILSETVEKAMAAGDFDGDGGSELAVGAPDTTYLSGADEPGEVWVWSDDDLTSSGTLNQTDAWASVQGDDLADSFGHAIFATDLLADGVDDLIIASPTASSNDGRISLILLD